MLSLRFDSSAAAENSPPGGRAPGEDADRTVDVFARLLLRLPSLRPQKGRQALRDVTGAEAWAGADDDYDRAVSFSPAAFTWQRSVRNLVELPALWTAIPRLGRDPAALWAAARAVLDSHGCPLPSFVVADDAALTLVWALEPLRRPREGKPEFHFRCFFEQLECWRRAAIKLSYAFEPLGARVLDVAAADEALLGFVPLPPRPDGSLARHAAELGFLPAAFVHVDEGAAAVRIAAVSRPLRRLDERLFAALGRPPLARGRRRWRDSDVSRAARVPQTAGARHPAALKLACAHRWDGLSREASLAELRAWAATCEDDGAFPARRGRPGADELEALVDWADKALLPGGPTPRDGQGAPRRARRRTSRDHVAAAVCGFLVEAGGAFDGSLVDLGKRAALWALDHGVVQAVPLRTLKRAVVDLVALGEVVREVVRVGSTWCSSFALRAASASSREKAATTALALVSGSPGQQGESMWAPGLGPAFGLSTFRGGPGGAFPRQGGSGGETETETGHEEGLVDPSPAACLAVVGAAVADPLTTAVTDPPAGATVASPAPPADVGGPARAPLSSARGSRQRRLPWPRARSERTPARTPARTPGEGLPPVDGTVAAALADVGRHLSGADHEALLQEARAGLFARPRVLADFVGALRRRALRILRLREIAAASAAHLLARRRAEDRAALPGSQPALSGPSALPAAPGADEPSAVVFAEFRRMLAARVTPLHERTPIERARRLQTDGLSLLVLPPRSKKPAGPWKQQQQQRLTLRRLEQELAPLGPDAGLAVVCGEISGVVVADLDDAAAVAWAREYLPDTPWKTRTARGEHWYYRLPFDPTGAPFVPPSTLPWKGELRAAGHYVVAPGSWHPDGGRYVALGDWGVSRDALPTWSLTFLPPTGGAGPVGGTGPGMTLGSVETWREARRRVLKDEP